MPIPDNVRLKLGRAEHHLDSLKSEVARALCHLNSDGVVLNKESETGDYVWTIDEPITTMEQIAVLAGDCVHNLRSLLDHIVWALDPKPDRWPLPEFPIYEKPGPGFFREHMDRSYSIIGIDIETNSLKGRVPLTNSEMRPMTDCGRV